MTGVHQSGLGRGTSLAAWTAKAELDAWGGGAHYKNSIQEAAAWMTREYEMTTGHSPTAITCAACTGSKAAMRKLEQRDQQRSTRSGEVHWKNIAFGTAAITMGGLVGYKSARKHPGVGAAVGALIAVVVAIGASGAALMGSEPLIYSPPRFPQPTPEWLK